MKNLLIYISQTDSFNNPCPGILDDAEVSAKVQIENSLRLGGQVEDILLYTNFGFRYGEVSAHVLTAVEFVGWKPQASKINAIIKMFENGLIEDNEIFWFQDLDAFQLHPFQESELNLGTADVGMTNYYVTKIWSTGTIFFKQTARDIFNRVKEIMYDDAISEEYAFKKLTESDRDMAKRVKKINATYNFVPYFAEHPCYKQAIKPIRVAHFHPLCSIPTSESIRVIDYSKEDNDVNNPFIPEALA